MIGLPEGIRAYGNDAADLYIRARRRRLLFNDPPEVTGALLRRMDRILPYRSCYRARSRNRDFVLRKTQFGRHIMRRRQSASRDPDRHSRRSRSSRIYVLSATTAGIAGFQSTLRFTAGSAVTATRVLSSIAAVIIGGVSLFGGAAASWARS